MTLKEYLEDYASDATQKVGIELIKKEVETLENKNVKEIVIENLEKIHNGERDFKF